MCIRDSLCFDKSIKGKFGRFFWKNFLPEEIPTEKKFDRPLKAKSPVFQSTTLLNRKEGYECEIQDICEQETLVICADNSVRPPILYDLNLKAKKFELKRVVV